MNIKITNPTNPIAQDKPKYPYLAKCSDGKIVLFTSKESGFSLMGSNYPVGYYSDEWAEEDYVRLSPGVEITLSND